MSAHIRLGVNIDHIATLRQARYRDDVGAEPEPSVLAAALAAERVGADGITVHLREDRRHIQDADLFQLRPVVRHLNLEMATVDAIVNIALRLGPDQCTLVPERRQEVTTEGGLDIVGQFDTVARVTKRLQAAGILVSLFIDADAGQIDASIRAGVDAVELHTGAYANADAEGQKRILAQIKAAAVRGVAGGIAVYAGHGLRETNIAPICRMKEITELNIGHSIVARAITDGWEMAVQRMLRLMQRHRKEVEENHV